MLAECWAIVFAPGRRIDDALTHARSTLRTVVEKMPLPTEVAEEQRLIGEIVQARREISQSKQALLSGDESITSSEASRQIAAREAAGDPHAGETVAAECLACQRKKPAAPRMRIPITDFVEPTEPAPPADLPITIIPPASA